MQVRELHADPTGNHLLLAAGVDEQEILLAIVEKAKIARRLLLVGGPGLGSARRYEEARTEADMAPLRETFRRFHALGGKALDTSPTYGNAEAIMGQIMAEQTIRPDLFVCTNEVNYTVALGELRRRPRASLLVYDPSEPSRRAPGLRPLPKYAARVSR